MGERSKDRYENEDEATAAFTPGKSSGSSKKTGRPEGPNRDAPEEEDRAGDPEDDEGKTTFAAGPPKPPPPAKPAIGEGSDRRAEPAAPPPADDATTFAGPSSGEAPRTPPKPPAGSGDDVGRGAGAPPSTASSESDDATSVVGPGRPIPRAPGAPVAKDEEATTFAQPAGRSAEPAAPPPPTAFPEDSTVALRKEGTEGRRPSSPPEPRDEPAEQPKTDTASPYPAETTIVMGESRFQPRLLLRGAEGGARERPIREAEIVLGRSPECDVFFPNPEVSRQHAKIVERDGAHVLVVLERRGTTFVNGERVKDEQVLRHGDRVRLGPVEILYGETGDRLSFGFELSREKLIAAAALVAFVAVLLFWLLS